MLRLCLPVAIESQIDSDSNRRCLTYVLASQVFGHELWGSRQASKLRTHSQATAAPYMICYDLLAHLHTIYRGSTFSPMQACYKTMFTAMYCRISGLCALLLHNSPSRHTLAMPCPPSLFKLVQAHCGYSDLEEGDEYRLQAIHKFFAEVGIL